MPFVADGGPASPVAAVTMFRGTVIAAISAAAERFAALAALAAHAINRQANWQEAIGWVVKAADMGNAAAQLQMKVLPAPKDVRAQGSWLQLARRIDIRGLPAQRAIAHQGSRVARDSADRRFGDAGDMSVAGSKSRFAATTGQARGLCDRQRRLGSDQHEAGRRVRAGG